MEGKAPSSLPPPPNLGTATTTTTTSLANELGSQRTLKPTETKVTTLADLGYVDDNPAPGSGNKLGFNEDEDPTEYFDLPDVFRSKVAEVAEIIRNAKRVVVYTGAGISTGPGADLPDYRGTEGVWTLRDKGQKPKKSLASLETALPTYGHMAVVALLKAGFFHYVVSTNVDGLHMRSGVPMDQLSELHGNAYLERCADCGTPYFRDFDVTNTLVDHYSTHRTGRKCEQGNCRGELRDSIIHFGENLPKLDLFNADAETKLADVALVLGTSLRVSPANQFPVSVQRRNLGHLIICNLQKTPFDRFAKNISRGYTDDFLYLLTQALAVEVDLEVPIHSNKNKGKIFAPDYVNIMDEFYVAKQEVWKKQLKEFEAKCKAFKKKQLETVISAGAVGKRRERKIIEGQDGVTCIIEDTHPSQMVLITNCTNCNFTLSRGPIAKLVIANCSATTVEVLSTVLTSTMEILGCSGLAVTSCVPLLTVSVDNSKVVSLNFKGTESFKMIVSCQVERLTVSARGEIHEASTTVTDEEGDLTEEEKAVKQFITSWVDDKISTDKVVRQGEGGTLITTEREAAEYAEKQQRNDEAMEEYVRGMIKIGKKDEGK